MTSPSRTGIERSDAAAVSERRRGIALRIQFNVLEFSGRVGLASVLLLIATPVARVAFSLVAFVLQRDRTYVVVTLTVLSILAYSLMSSGL